jgi:NADPH-dependent ferric siderophore reductase
MKAGAFTSLTPVARINTNITATIMNIIKQTALTLFENALAKEGTILAIRSWDPATFFELDIHFPALDMSGWNRVQHMKVKVAPGIYRDYTPAGWDVETRTCTLYINATQEGPGSEWVRSLKQGDLVTYVGVGATMHRPAEEGNMVVFGDMATIGHYLALQQLAGSKTITGAIAIEEESHRAEFMEYFNWGVQPVIQTDQGGFHALTHWARDKDLKEATVYVAGHIPSCGHLRKELKKSDCDTVRVQGFWG